jgi:hypothetical protein
MESIDKEVEGERLRQVRALIEDLLREADICAQVVLAGREGRFESFTHLDASWCKLRIEKHAQGEYVGVRSKLVDYGGDREKQRQELAWSVGVASGFSEIGGRVALSWMEASSMISQATNAQHTDLERDDPRDEP